MYEMPYSASTGQIAHQGEPPPSPSMAAYSSSGKDRLRVGGRGSYETGSKLQGVKGRAEPQKVIYGGVNPRRHCSQRYHIHHNRGEVLKALSDFTLFAPSLALLIYPPTSFRHLSRWQLIPVRTYFPDKLFAWRGGGKDDPPY